MAGDRQSEIIERGRRLAEWANGDAGLFQIMDGVRKDYLATLTTSEITETALREATYHRIRALDDVRRVMEEMIQQGKTAAEIATRKQRGRE